jgi:hypothetical protein
VSGENPTPDAIRYTAVSSNLLKEKFPPSSVIENFKGEKSLFLKETEIPAKLSPLSSITTPSIFWDFIDKGESDIIVMIVISILNKFT